MNRNDDNECSSADDPGVEMKLILVNFIKNIHNRRNDNDNDDKVEINELLYVCVNGEMLIMDGL